MYMLIGQEEEKMGACLVGRLGAAREAALEAVRQDLLAQQEREAQGAKAGPPGADGCYQKFQMTAKLLSFKRTTL